MKKVLIFGVVFGIFFGIFFLFVIGYEKERIAGTRVADIRESRANERTFAYEKCMKLTDGKFWVNYCVQSDSEEAIAERLNKRPYIRVSKYIEKDFNTVQQPLARENISEPMEYPKSERDIAEVINDSNIPSGYMMEIKYRNLEDNIF